MAAPKRQTRAQLEAELAKLRDEHRAEYGHRCAAEAREKETRAQFADLKERLAFSECEVQRMGGYIARVQEDDIVREPLIKTGDPQGEQQLVPKRKPTRFYPLQRAEGGSIMCTDGAYHGGRAGCNDKPQRHWVNY